MQLWSASYENLKCVALSLSLNLRQRLEILANHAQEGQDDEQSLLSTKSVARNSESEAHQK